MAKSDESLSEFSNFMLENEEPDVEKSLSSTTIDDNYDNFVNYGKTEAEFYGQTHKKRKVEQDYKKLRIRIEEVIRSEKKLRNKKEKNPLYWCLVGSEYSDCCRVILETISRDLSKLSPPKNLDEMQDLEAIKRKYRVIKAYDLLLLLNDCFKRIYGRINDCYNRLEQSRYHYTHLAPSMQGFESNAKVIEEYIDMLKQFVNTMFEMKHRE